MRSLSGKLWLLPCLALAVSACSAGADRALSPDDAGSGALLAIGGGDGGCQFEAVTSGVLPPINADHSSVFELRRTIPVMIRVTDCATKADRNDLTPQISLVAIGADGDVQVNEIESSSAADEGTQMRNAGTGKYMFNLSTKNSQFNAGEDLVPGRYQLTISDPSFADVVVQFTLRR